MSLQVFVFSNRRLESVPEWQRFIDAAQFDIVLPADTLIDDLRGLLPVRLSGIETGFECDHRDPDKVMSLYHRIDFGGDWTFCLSFRCAGGFEEWLAVNMAAAAYADAAGGIVFDPQDNLVLSAREALRSANDMKREMAEWKRRAIAVTRTALR